jgi:hypothetical protein
MKKVSVIVLVIVGLVFAGYAEAAKPKKRTRNANRIGPYAGLLVGQTSFSGDHSNMEAFIESAFVNEGDVVEGLTISTKDSDIGYQAVFGYRFMRYLAAELGLAQYGDLTASGRADVLFQGQPEFLPTTVKLKNSISGPVFSAIGVVPFNDKFELFGRAGLLFASSKVEAVERADGEVIAFGNAKGDSTELVLGFGFSWNINPMYSIRGEVQKIDGVGESGSTAKEDLMVSGLALIVRF